ESTSTRVLVPTASESTLRVAMFPSSWPGSHHLSQPLPGPQHPQPASPRWNCEADVASKTTGPLGDSQLSISMATNCSVAVSVALVSPALCFGEDEVASNPMTKPAPAKSKKVSADANAVCPSAACAVAVNFAMP